jgi:branched-chain amino acid aminotransferase
MGNQGIGWRDGQFAAVEDTTVPVLDFGFNKSDAVYDGIPFTARRLFRLDDHIERLFESVRRWRLNLVLSKAEVRALCRAVVARSSLQDGIVYPVVSRGLPPSPTQRNPALFEARFTVWSQAVPNLLAAGGGLRVMVARTPRIPDTCVDSLAKNLHWGDLMRARLEAHDAGVDNAILLSLDGEVTEGPGFNIFVVKDRRLSTPVRHCLHGITRRSVLELADGMGLQAQQRQFGVAELQAADEVFFTTSAGGVLPVTEVDGCKLPSTSITQALRQAYLERRVSPLWSVAADD